MLKSEFMELITAENHPRLDQEYSMIEYVYTWHPLQLTKEEAALLYDRFGVGIFIDMYNTASEAERLETESVTARSAYDDAATRCRNHAEKYKR